jgi:TonB-linked SusC/RagA family outer membrane protein
LQTQNAYFGRLSYDYNGKYLAQLTMRTDAFDMAFLPLQNRWGYFPAASLGWIVSKETFMESSSSFIDHLKLRVSWGQNGSLAGLGNYGYLTSITSSGSYPFSSEPVYSIGYQPAFTGNLELKWETHQQTNVGFDARFLNNRLILAFDYFNKKTKDLIVTGITPSTIVGNTASPINAGNIENKGIELELGWQENINKFHYGVRGNMSTIRNKVTNIHQSLDYIAGTGFHTTSGITRFEVGKPAWYFCGYEFQGIDEATGDPVFVDQNNDNIINDDDKIMLGKGIPDLNYGITVNADYKGFDIVVFGQGSYGNDIYSCLNRTDYAVNSLTYFTEGRWTVDNQEGTKPRAGANDLDKYYTSSAAIFDGSYFKVKQIQLGYSLSKPMLNKLKIERFRIYASLEDYFTMTQYMGFDPEVTGVGNALGVDKGSYPTAKKVIFGVNISF